MNMFKKNGGFTLVELIVVIAILAILAGIAVPAYSGYIKKAEEAASYQALNAVSTTAQGVAAGKSASVTDITVDKDGKITVVCDPDTVKVTADDIAGYITGVKYGKNFAGASWSSTTGEWKLN